MRGGRVFGAGERTATQSNKNNTAAERGHLSVDSRSDEGAALRVGGQSRGRREVTGEVAGGHTDGVMSEVLL